MADTGWVVAGRGQNITGVGTIAWTNPGNVTARDTTEAQATSVPKNTGRSNYLRGDQFGFSIPSGSTIDGIEFRARLRVNNAIRDNARLENGNIGKDGSTLATAKAWVGFGNSNVLYDVVLGGPTDLWGLSWTTAEINSSDFLLQFNVWNPVAASQTMWCDSIEAKIYYTEATASETSWGFVLG